MRILITGYKGYIGSRLWKALERDKHDLIGIDLEDGQNILTCELPDVDVVYHLAAQAGAIPSTKDPLWDAKCNILGTIRIAERYENSKIIYTTSGAAVQPIESPYGLSKHTGEEYLKLIAKYPVILRLSSVYGEKPKGVVDTFIREEKPIVYGDGSSVRDFVHVDDIVRGLVEAMGWWHGEYEMGSGIGTSVQEIAEATGKEITYMPARAGEKEWAVLENTTPSWKPQIDVLKYVKSQC